MVARPPHGHQVLDAVAELSGHKLHALRQIAGERLRLVAGRLAQRTCVARVRVERDRSERHHRQQEEGDDEAEAKAHKGGREASGLL